MRHNGKRRQGPWGGGWLPWPSACDTARLYLFRNTVHEVCRFMFASVACLCGSCWVPQNWLLVSVCFGVILWFVLPFFQIIDRFWSVLDSLWCVTTHHVLLYFFCLGLGGHKYNRVVALLYYDLVSILVGRAGGFGERLAAALHRRQLWVPLDRC